MFFMIVQIAGVVTLPFDVVKTHRQIELGKKIINSKFLSCCGLLLFFSDSMNIAVMQ